MELIYLGIVFAAIVILLICKRPLWQCILPGLVLMIVLYRLPIADAAMEVWRAVSEWSSLSVLLAMYLTALLQNILEARGQIKGAQRDLDHLFHHRRINTVGALLFIGLVPSAAAMLIGGQIVRDNTEGYLKPKEQATAASWLRHVPESSLPTYTSVLLLLSLAEVSAGAFMLCMIIPFAVLVGIGYVRYLRKIPKEPVEAVGDAPMGRGKALLSLLGHLWSLLLVVVLILALNISVVPVLGIVIVLCLVVYRVKFSELLPMLGKSLHIKMMVNTLAVLLLKNFIGLSGVLTELPAIAEALPLPAFLTFGLLLFAATVVSGGTGAIALVVPLAVGVLGANLPMAVYMASICHAASQVSPTHVCVAVASEYFGVSLGETIKATVPMSLLFAALMTGYYLLLGLVL